MHKATIVTVISASAMTVISASAGYYAAKKRLESQFEERLENEVASTKEFYVKLNKADEFKTPEEAVKALHPETKKESVVKMGAEAAEAMATYQGEKVRVLPQGVALMAPVEEAEESDEETLDSLEEKELSKSGSQTLFEGEEINPDDFDIETERAGRRHREGEAYVVSLAEYDENPDQHEQEVLTYFAYDDVLVDENEKEIDRIEETVGKANLRRFGHGSNDSKIVYIRNEAMATDYEVLRSDGSYAEEVLGLAQDDDDRSVSQEPMRRRRSAEE